MAMFSDRERIFFSVFAPLLFLMTSVAGRADDSSECDPDVCRTVKLNQPQLFVDDDLIENRYNEKFLSSRVPHVRHAAKRGPPIRGLRRGRRTVGERPSPGVEDAVEIAFLVEDALLLRGDEAGGRNIARTAGPPRCGNV